MTEYYKVLDNLQSTHGGQYQWTPDEWTPPIADLVVCERGYHVCRREYLVYWLGPDIWACEVKPEGMIEEYTKVVVASVRLVVEKLDAWNGTSARLFAADCAEHVLPIYEKEYKSKAPRQAIQAARDYAHGKITKEDLVDAWAAARTAADAWADAPADAWAAAEAAAWAAAAPTDAWAAAGAAEAGAEAAAGAAAGAWEAEREWQTERLFWYLEGEANE